MLQRDSSNRDGDGRICWLVFIRVTIKRNRKRDEEWNRGERRIRYRMHCRREREKRILQA